jgi:hypothetical protein
MSCHATYPHAGYCLLGRNMSPAPRRRPPSASLSVIQHGKITLFASPSRDSKKPVSSPSLRAAPEPENQLRKNRAPAKPLSLVGPFALAPKLLNDARHAKAGKDTKVHRLSGSVERPGNVHINQAGSLQSMRQRSAHRATGRCPDPGSTLRRVSDPRHDAPCRFSVRRSLIEESQTLSRRPGNVVSRTPGQPLLPAFPSGWRAPWRGGRF